MTGRHEARADRTRRISSELVSKARDAALEIGGELFWESSPRGLIRRELALALEHIDDARRLHRLLDNDLLEAECSVGTLLESAPDQERLHAQMLQIHAERRRLRLIEMEKEGEQSRRLLTLLDRDAQLGFENED